MEYFWHFVKFLGIFAVIIALSLFTMQVVAGGQGTGLSVAYLAAIG